MKSIRTILCLIGFALLMLPRASFAAPQTSALPWTVFAPATSGLPMGANLLQNPAFENGAANWQTYESGFSIDAADGHGGAALRLNNPVETATHGAYQVLTLQQATPQPLYFSGWSKASNVTGSANNDYSIYIDVYYTDNTALYGQTLDFDTGTHDWQFRESYIVPAKPIASLSVFCLLRNSHTGMAWFDDLSVQVVDAQLLNFDGTAVATSAPGSPPYGGANLVLATNDGLAMKLSADGGAVTELSLDGNAVQDASHIYTGGFLLRDVAAQSDFVHVGGTVTQNGTGLTQSGNAAPLNLDFNATYTASSDRIAIHGTVADTTGSERAVTIYFALPVDANGWTWGDDIRTASTIEGSDEFANYTWWDGIGANNALSKYPWASVNHNASGIALALPLDAPRAFRLAHNPVTNQLYAAFDVGLSPQAKTPGQATMDLVLYRFDGAWGFRAATQAYYEHFPNSFTRRVPANREGIWVAFDDLDPIANVNDFHIAFHEGDPSQVPFDDAHNIYSFRYISEPWSHWLPLNGSTPVDVHNYDQVMAYLQDRHQNGSQSERDTAEATLGSGTFDANNQFRYRSQVEAWCGGRYGCAVFTVNPAPDIFDAVYPLNKAQLDWNDAARATYTTTPGLDGEYIDSYLSEATALDFRAAHFSGMDTPLTFEYGTWRAGAAEMFATTEFARRLTNDVHDNLQRMTMANGVLIDLPWGADLFDMMGGEVDWIPNGNWQPYDDSLLNYRRTLAAQRPYGFLMNTHFADLTNARVEQYFQICLLYGIYPSMFSANASTQTYWSQPTLYNRDRALFKKYIPLFQQINAAGWQPVTYATASDAKILLERFGATSNLYFTVRNPTNAARTFDVHLDAPALGLNADALTAVDLVSGKVYVAKGSGATRTIHLTLAANTTATLALGNANSIYFPFLLRQK